jgi:chemotaxis protein CheC
MPMDLSEMETDALREVGNVGVGNAVTSLSKLLNKKVGIDIPETRFVPLDEFSKIVGGAEQVVIGIYMQISGDLEGESVFLFPKECALELVDLMMGNPPGTSKIFEDMAESAFKEMANIFSGSYLSSLSNFLDITLFPGIPHLANDMVQSIVDFVLIKISQSAEQVLLVKTAINIEGHNVNGDFVLLLQDKSLRIMLEKLKEKYGIVG